MTRQFRARLAATALMVLCAAGILLLRSSLAADQPVFATDQVVRLPAEPILIEAVSGKKVTFTAEIADNDATRSRGMMFRRSMQEHEAMLFIWSEPRDVGMWMRNTYISLDMVFITDDGEIVHIARETVPHSLDVVSANRDVLAVLEIKGGAAARLGVSVGDRVRHRFFADE